MIGHKSLLIVALAMPFAASPAFALTPEQEAAAEEAFALAEQAEQCGDTVRKRGMRDYAWDLAVEQLTAAGLSEDDAIALYSDLVDRARAELTVETIARSELECFVGGPQQLVDWLNEPWIAATAPNYGWWHGPDGRGVEGGVFRFEDDTTFDYQCSDDDVINVGAPEDPTAMAARVISIYLWDDHSGPGYLSIDGKTGVNLDFSYSDDLEDSFAQYHVRSDAPQAEKDRFDAIIDAIANGDMMRITVGTGNIIEIALEGAAPIAICNS